MSEIASSIWADGMCGYMFTKSLITPCTEYTRADLVAEKDAEIERLRKALEQALDFSQMQLLNGKLIACEYDSRNKTAWAELFSYMEHRR